MNKKFEEAEARILQLRKEQEAAKADYTAQIEAGRAELKAAEDALATASKGTDVDAYQAAHKAREEAAVKIELFERKLNELERTPAMEQEEYAQLSETIFEALRAEDAAALKKLEDLAQQMKKIGAQLETTIEHGNDLLCTMQYHLRRDPHLLQFIGKDWDPEYYARKYARQYKEGRTCYFAQVADSHNPYKK